MKKYQYYKYIIACNEKQRVIYFKKNDPELKWFKKNFAGVFKVEDISKYFLIKEGYSFNNDKEFELIVKNISQSEWKKIIYDNIKKLKKVKMGRGSKYGEWFLSELILNGIIENKSVYKKVEQINNKVKAISNGIELKNSAWNVVCKDGEIYRSVDNFIAENNWSRSTYEARVKSDRNFSEEELFDTKKNYAVGNRKKVFYNEKWYNSIGELLKEYNVNRNTFDAVKKRMVDKYKTSFSIAEVLEETLKIREKTNNKYVVNGINYHTIQNVSKTFGIEEESISSQKRRLQKKYNRPFTYDETVNYILKIRADKGYVVNGVEYNTIEECGNDFGISLSVFRNCRHRLEKKHNRKFSVEEVINYILNRDAKNFKKIHNFTI